MRKILVDGNNLGWMSFGRTPLSYKGKRTETIFLALSMIRSYLEFPSQGVIVVWDGGIDEYRMSLYPEYKRQRRTELTEIEKGERNTFFEQLKALQEILSILGLLQYKLKGREADDVIYSLVKESYEDDYLVISTDKDFYQLLTVEGVEIYSPVKKEFLTKDAVEEKLGIPIEYYVDYKAMVGDSSDNLPGIKGIGPKNAKWLINSVFDKRLEQAPNKVETRMMGLLFDNLDTFGLMRKLISLREISDGELERGKVACKEAGLGEMRGSVKTIFEAYGFNRFLDRFNWFMSPFEDLWARGQLARGE